MPEQHRISPADPGRPLYAGILIGGRSARMGRPKHLLEVAGLTLLDRVAAALAPVAGRPVLLGAGPLPPGWADAVRVPDAPGAAGPVAGLLAAMRWAPSAAWLLAACDLPAITTAAVAWLLGERRPERWAVFPSLDGVHPEPMLALYEPRARALLEEALAAGRGPSSLARHPRAALVTVPTALRASWRDVDTPADFSR
jgi:molybdopterin-guanine dinucleotide biosynthesis protein A